MSNNNELRAEANILMERVTVLKEQEKRYTDLSSEIQQKKSEMITLDDTKDRINKEIQVKETESVNQTRKLGIVQKEIRDEEAKLDKIRLDYEREAHHYNTQKKEFEDRI